MAFRFRTERHLDTSEAALLHALRFELSAVRPQMISGDRLKTTEIRDAMAPSLERRGFLFSDSHGAFVNTDGVALTIHGGRAFTNNEAVWRLLQLAGRPRTRAVVAVVPQTYKGGACASKVEQQLEELARNRGVAIDLAWAAHIAYKL